MKTFDEVLIPSDYHIAWIERLGNMEFLSDQMFSDSDKYSNEYTSTVYRQILKGFDSVII